MVKSIKQHLSLLPIFVFLVIFLGSGIYFSLKGVDYAFYQVSPSIAILPALLLGIMVNEGSLESRLTAMIDGMRDKDIMTMCLIFLLAGAFGCVTESVGCVHDSVQFALDYLPDYALLPGIFLIAAFISTAIGTSMGVVAAITPVAVGFAHSAGLSLPMAVGAVMSGAMFGDNLSLISDTTIAAVNTQGASLQEKFKLNAKIALATGIITFFIYLFFSEAKTAIEVGDYSLLKVFPYVAIVVLAMTGMNVFTVLTLGILLAGAIGFFGGDYTVLGYSKDIAKGFTSMQDILVLSLLVGGMGGLLRSRRGLEALIDKIGAYLHRKVETKGRRRAEVLICGIAAFNDICIANNTIAIILAGDSVKKIAKDYEIPPHRAACWVDIFTCVFQGLIPYGAQALLASSMSGVAPTSICLNAFYCVALGIVTLVVIFFKRPVMT